MHVAGRIIEYDSSTLKTLGSYETSQDHIPWVGINPSDGILYSSEFDNVSSLSKYDSFRSYSALEPLQLNSVINQVQGGSVYLNHLYITSNNDLKSVYEVNIDTGEVLKVVDTIQYVNKWSELEGIAIYGNKAYILYNDLLRWLLVTILSGVVVSLLISFGLYKICKKLARGKEEFEGIEMKGITYSNEDDDEEEEEEEEDYNALVHKVNVDRKISKRDAIVVIVLSTLLGFGFSYVVCGEYVVRGTLLTFDLLDDK